MFYFYFVKFFCFKVQIYNPVTKLVHKTLSKFVENAYGGSYRSDGQLLCAGSEDSNVKIFDVNTKSLLRVFKGHRRYHFFLNLLCSRFFFFCINP